MSVTLQQILVAVRELSFDRYPIPVFSLKTATSKYLTNNGTNFKILPNKQSTTPLLDIDLTVATTQDLLTDALISGGYPLAYSGYYKGSDLSTIMLRLTDASMDAPVNMFRRFFMSDASLTDIVVEYFRLVLKNFDETTVSITTSVADLDTFTLRHLTLWCSLKVVEFRRLAEVGNMVMVDSYTDGSGLVAGSNLGYPGQVTNVNIGGVFSLTDDNSVTGQYFQEDFNRVGSDNVLGDKESFWFKLFIWLRAKIETEYKDYNWRSDNAIYGKVSLESDLKYFQFWDTYPFVLSPLTRGIMK